MAMAEFPPNLPAHVDQSSTGPMGMVVMMMQPHQQQPSPPSPSPSPMPSASASASASMSSSSPSPLPLPLPLPQHTWPPAADQRDAYIAWLRAEFAAANAIIDSMCHHLRTIGGPGEYEPVFSSLQRRRHPWAPSLYMQQFFSVAEIVNSLQHIAWSRRASPLPSMGSTPASVGHFTCPPHPVHYAAEHKKILKDEAQPKKTQPGSSTPAALAPTSTTGTPLCKAQSPSCPEKNIEENVELGTGAQQIVAQEVALPPATLKPRPLDDDAAVAACEIGKAHEEDDTQNLHPDGAQPTDSLPEETDGVKNKTEGATEVAPCSPDPDTAACRNSTLSDESPSDQPASSKEHSASIIKGLLIKDMPFALEEKDERLASIKRSMQFQCSEHEDGQMISNGESAELCENVFNSTEITDLVKIIHQLQDAGKRGELGRSYSKKSDSAPDILQFGHKQRNASEKNDIQPIPKFMHSVINWLSHCGILLGNRKPDSCIINIFDEGDFEAPNTDQCAWEKPLCIVSLIGECRMIFGHSISSDEQGNCKGPFQVVVPAGSILLLQEHFAGLLQKAIPASASRRITIALGKACANMATKGRNKWTTGDRANSYAGNAANKQAFMAPITPLHPSPHMPNHRHAHPSLPNPNTLLPNPVGGLMNPYMAHPSMTQEWLGLPRAPRVPNPGTGVFFPLNDAHSAPSWRSGLIVVSSFSPKNGSLVEVRRSSHSKKGEKHGNHQFSANQARIKVSLDLIATKKRSNKHLTVASACQEIDGTEDGKSQPIRASSIQV